MLAVPAWQRYLFVSTVCSSCQSVFVTNAMLTPLTDMDSSHERVFQFIGKDIVGQVGSLLVMSGLSSTVDSNPRRFVKTAHLLQQTGVGLLYLTPFYPHWFMSIGGVSNMMISVSFMCFGALNAKCIQKAAAEKNNAGQMYATLTIQQTLASSIGLGLGLTLKTWCPLPDEVYFALFGVGRIWSYNRGINSIL